MTVVLSACILQKLYKICGFFCSHFNIEDGRKQATFSAYYALLVNKGKKHKKRFVQCEEGAVME